MINNRPRVRMMIKPVGNGHELVGFIPAGTDYSLPGDHPETEYVVPLAVVMIAVTICACIGLAIMAAFGI
jgi:hypothetical protein